MGNPLGRCPKSNYTCRLTSDRSLIEQSDAVIFYAFTLNVTSDMPKFRSPQQQWIFFNLEPPTGRQGILEKQLKNLPPHLWFNLTFTYRYVKNFVHFLKNHFQLTANYYLTIFRWDSDVVHPYGQFCSGKKSSSDVNAIIANKTKLVAWIVSNCGGERFNYVTELQKYIKVDIYGGCGPLKNCSGNCSKQVYH